MKLNVGSADRLIRLILGVLLILAPFVSGWALFANPLWIWIFLLAGAVLAVTGVLRFCPGYAVFGLSTRSAGKE